MSSVFGPCFDIERYVGCWYELAHYRTWFDVSDNYNTTAQYTVESTCDGPIIHVVNSTINQGIKYESKGTAKYLGQMSLRVEFPMAPESEEESDEPNYVIDRIWTNQHGEYIFAVVTNPTRGALYVLSRYPQPSLSAYNELMTYISSRYDRSQIVQTPQYG